MIKKFIVVGALGVAGLGVAAASASALPVQTTNNNEAHGRLQQSDSITATCQTTQLQFQYLSTPSQATTNTLNVPNIDYACYGSVIAAVAYDHAGNVLGTTTVDRLDGSGYSFNPYTNGNPPAQHIAANLTFPTPVNIQDVDHTVITISDGLHN